MAKRLGGFLTATVHAIREHVGDEDNTTALIQGGGTNSKTQVIIINESGLHAIREHVDNEDNTTAPIQGGDSNCKTQSIIISESLAFTQFVDKTDDVLKGGGILPIPWKKAENDHLQRVWPHAIHNRTNRRLVSGRRFHEKAYGETICGAVCVISH